MHGAICMPDEEQLNETGEQEFAMKVIRHQKLRSNNRILRDFLLRRTMNQDCFVFMKQTLARDFANTSFERYITGYRFLTRRRIP